MADDVGYVTKGPPGHQCADCQHYEPDTDDPSVGKCMGEDVESGASCS